MTSDYRHKFSGAGNELTQGLKYSYTRSCIAYCPLSRNGLLVAQSQPLLQFASTCTKGTEPRPWSQPASWKSYCYDKVAVSINGFRYSKWTTHARRLAHRAAIRQLWVTCRSKSVFTRRWTMFKELSWSEIRKHEDEKLKSSI